MKPISIRQDLCGKCGQVMLAVDCSDCGGHGQTEELPLRTPAMMVPCQRCNGAGYLLKCTVCDHMTTNDDYGDSTYRDVPIRDKPDDDGEYPGGYGTYSDYCGAYRR